MIAHEKHNIYLCWERAIKALDLEKIKVIKKNDMALQENYFFED